MKQVAIPRECYTGSSNKLFDFLAGQLAGFIREQEEKHKVRAHQQRTCIHSYSQFNKTEEQLSSCLLYA